MKKRAHHWEDTVQGASRDECVLDALGDAPSKPKQAKQQQEEPPQQQQQQKQNRGIPSDPPGWERIVRKKRDEHRLTQQRLAWLEQTFGKFRRPNTTEFLKQPKAQFYLHDLDYCNEVPNRKFSDPVVRLCCLTEQGNSVCVRVHGVSAYFYVKPNRALQHRLDTLPEKQVLEEFAAWLNKQTKQHVGVHDTPPEDCVVGMERLQRSHYYGFERDKITVLLVRMASPRLVVPARNALWALRRKIRPETMAEKIAGWSMEDVVADDEADRSEDDMMQDDEEIHWESGLEADALRTDPFELFEADVLFTLRFLIDTRMAGCAWFEAAWDKLQLVPHEKRHSRLQLEYDMNMQDLVSLPDKDTVPREIRILAVDYEMGGRRGHFPQAELDPILCGSFMLFRVEDGIKPIVACSIFVGDSDATQFKGLPEGTPLIDVQCGRGHPAPNGRWNREAEAEMLLIIQWLEVNIFQHDYFGGYNSRNFDKRYELQRSDALGISNTMRRCGKLHDEIAIVNLKTFSSKAQNTRTDAEIRQWGIMDFDAMHILRRDGKRFRSFRLNDVGYGVLGETKFGLSHELISPYYMGPESSMEKRRIVRDYNHQDTWLSYRLLEKFKYMFRLQGVARRTSLPMEMVLSRGQGIKSEMLILSACKREGFVAPTFATMREKLSKGGWGMDMSKYDPSLMGERYRDDELFDEDDDEDEEGEQAVKNRVPMERELHYNVFADECYLVHATEEQVLESQRNELWRGEGSQRRPTLQPENGRVLLFFACPKSQALLGVAELLWRDEGRVKWLIQIPLVRANLPECLRPLANGQKLSPGVVMLAFLKLDGRGGKTGAGEKYKGAVVLKIMHGFYRVPVWTLDFSSLYPTSMIAHNLCPTTCFLLKDAERLGLKEGDYEITPIGACFVKPHIRKGLLPMELERVMAAREVSKKAVKTAKAAGQMDMVEVHDSDQNAYKLIANGTYGYQGAKTAKYPCLPVAAATTGFGRDAIMTVVDKLEGEMELPPDICPNGERPVIVGGDTDSVFGIWPNVMDPKRAAEMAVAAAEWVSKKYFPSPMKTIFEKLMFGVILEALKHYVYQYWSLDSINKFGKPDMVPVPGQPDKTQARLEAKGIEMVRRDNFMLMSDGMERKVRKILCDRDPVGAFVELQQELDDLRAGHTDPAQLIVSKSLSRAPRDYTVKAAHVNLAIRLEERNPDTAPRCGDRVRMVYRQGGPKDKISDLGEDPMYALKNNIPLNTKHYIDAYRKPMERLLETIMPGIVSRIFDDKPLQTDKRVQGTLFGSKKAEAPHATTAGKDDTPDRPISRGSQLTLDWARKMSKLNVGDVDKRLNEARLRYQNGTRTRNIVQIASQTAFGKRLLISETCLMCNTPVEDNRAVCVRCKEKQAQKVQTLRERTKQQREQYLAQKTQLWDKCRGCAGSDAAAKLCDNDGCASFFARDLAVIEYERTEKQMARFSLLDIL